jgi:hypothetical protein
VTVETPASPASPIAPASPAHPTTPTDTVPPVETTAQEDDPMPATLMPIAPEVADALAVLLDTIGPATALPGEACPVCDLTDARACPACNGTGTVDFV